jgi:DNA-binding CsgD family transcriptional regulator
MGPGARHPTHGGQSYWGTFDRRPLEEEKAPLAPLGSVTLRNFPRVVPMGRYARHHRGASYEIAGERGRFLMRKDVDMFAVQMALAVAARRGIARARLLRGLSIAGRVGSRDVPVSWDAYVTVIDRLGDALGSDAALAEAAGDLPAVTPQISAFAAFFVSPHRFGRFLAQVLDPRIWPCMRVTYDELGDDLARVVHSVPSHYREGRSVFVAAAGAWQTTPCRLGLPPAELVAADIGPRRGEYVLRLPKSATVTARMRATALEAFANFAVAELAADANAIEHAFAVPPAEREAQVFVPEGSERDAHEAASARWDLTVREAQVLAMVVRGFSNKQMATTLKCAVKTVEMHVTKVIRKSGAASRADLVTRVWRGSGPGDSGSVDTGT